MSKAPRQCLADSIRVKAAGIAATVSHAVAAFAAEESYNEKKRLISEILARLVRSAAFARRLRFFACLLLLTLLTSHVSTPPTPLHATQVINASELNVAEQKLVKVSKELEETKSERSNTMGRWGKITRLSRRPYMNIFPARVGTGEPNRSEGLRPASIAALEAKQARAKARRKAEQEATEAATRAKALEERKLKHHNHHFGSRSERKMAVGLSSAGNALSAAQH